MSRIILETPRLILREFTLEDHPALAALHGDPTVMEFIGGAVGADRSLEILKEYLSAYCDPGYSRWAIILRESGEMIGRAGPSREIVEDAPEVEVGYTLATNHWKKGYATEAATAVRDHCFKTLGLPRIISIIRENNVASQRVALRLGMRHERDVFWRGALKRVYAVEQTGGH